MSSDPIEFLRAVLPEEGEGQGYYALASPYRRNGKPNKIEFVTTVKALWDLQQRYLDCGDVYFSSCTFKVPDKDNADKDNVLWKRSFYLDLDFNPDEAVKVVGELVGIIKLPFPTILISSGRGLHVWWPLTESIDPNRWLRIAKGLRNSCEKHRLPIDHLVTANPVRLGRCPGTFNRKRACEVRFYEELSFELCDPNDFDHLAVGEPEVPSSPKQPLTGDLALYQAALAHIPSPEHYNEAILRGMELHELGDAGFEMWWNWYKDSHEAQSGTGCSQEQLRGHWNSFHDGREGDRTLRSLIWDAEQHGFDRSLHVPSLPNGEDRPQPNGEINGFDSGDPLAIHWHAMDGKEWIWLGKPENKVIKRREYDNARKAVAKEKIEGRYDYFTNQMKFKLPWQEEKGWQNYSDDKSKLNRVVRDYLCDHYGDMGLTNVEDAMKEIAHRYGSYNSVVDYLDRVEWKDKKPRLDTWLIDYCGAADTPVNREIGKLVLIAAVRRAKKPGSKFDHILILEGEEGIGKSQTVLILAGSDEHFSDAPILTLDAKRQHELLEGKWFYEISEFHGIRRTESDHLKAFISRQVERSRKAYAHDSSSTPRTCVCIVTTNYVEDQYLQEEMGLRRFWPVKIGRVKQDDLIRDRDQLFAEAVIREKDYHGYLDMPEKLREQLRVEQEKRRFDPEFEDVLSSIRGTPGKPVLGRIRETITTADIKDRLKLPLQHHSTTINRKITQAMKKLGWGSVQLTVDGHNLNGWERFVVEKK